MWHSASDTSCAVKPTVKGWGCLVVSWYWMLSYSPKKTVTGRATDQRKQRPASAADGSYLAASVEAPPPVEEEDRRDSSQRKLHTGSALSDAGSETVRPRGSESRSRLADSDLPAPRGPGSGRRAPWARLLAIVITLRWHFRHAKPLSSSSPGIPSAPVSQSETRRS